jgi:hypothetical protein
MKAVKNSIFYMIIVFLSLISCNKINTEEAIEDNNDNYYVKYVAYEDSERIMITDVIINTPDGEMTFPGSSKFEKSIGPIKKGFQASITVMGKGYKNGNPAYIEIHVSKNKEPFTIKLLKEANIGTGINDIGYGSGTATFIIGSEE